jgi:sugar phosphate isomerase/epimerase
MKICFSTLGCPDWTLAEALEIGTRCGYDGIELRFLEGEASLWKLADFSVRLPETCDRIRQSGLAVACLDTSCRFDAPDASERERWVEEGLRMAELAARLRAPGIRVFGDRLQPGQSREDTRLRLVHSLNVLIEKVRNDGVEVWLETHGDFACAADVQPILADCPALRLVWDPASAFIERGEQPLNNGNALRAAIRHVHIKDLKNKLDGWKPVLMGQGSFPFDEIRRVSESMNYSGFLSFEWEKKWHPEIEPPEVAIPHFANWFHAKWKN